MDRNPFNENAIIICKIGKQESFTANNILKTKTLYISTKIFG